MEGDPKFAVSQDLPAFGYAAFAQMLGLQGIRVDRPEGIGPALDQALAANVPTVLEMVTDPDVPPLPPHISVKQARAYISAMLHGDTDAGGRPFGRRATDGYDRKWLAVLQCLERSG